MSGTSAAVRECEVWCYTQEDVVESAVRAVSASVKSAASQTDASVWVWTKAETQTAIDNLRERLGDGIEIGEITKQQEADVYVEVRVERLVVAAWRVHVYRTEHVVSALKEEPATVEDELDAAKKALAEAEKDKNALSEVMAAATAARAVQVQFEKAAYESEYGKQAYDALGGGLGNQAAMRAMNYVMSAPLDERMQRYVTTNWAKQNGTDEWNDGWNKDDYWGYEAKTAEHFRHTTGNESLALRAYNAVNRLPEGSRYAGYVHLCYPSEWVGTFGVPEPADDLSNRAVWMDPTLTVDTHRAADEAAEKAAEAASRSKLYAAAVNRLLGAVVIGEQRWDARNVDASVYLGRHRAAPTRQATSASNFRMNATWCYYTEDGKAIGEVPAVTQDPKYGRLYHVTVDRGGLCPAGWRVPNVADWELLIAHYRSVHKTSAAICAAAVADGFLLGGHLQPTGFKGRGVVGVWWVSHIHIVQLDEVDGMRLVRPKRAGVDEPNLFGGYSVRLLRI
jgi:uncharacterized protein (TIGR02145 family)